MLTATAEQIRQLLQGHGGVPFTRFVDSLLRTHGHVHGLPDSEIDTNIRTNIPDGGVDSEVRTSIASDDTGWFGERTVWQLKGTGATNLSVAELVKGDHLRQRIEDGWAYRLALADSLPSRRRTELENDLAAHFRKWNGSTPHPRIVSADELAEWANRYPGLVLATFFAGASGELLHLGAWGPTATNGTGVYVPVLEWEPVVRAVSEHLDFASEPTTAVCTIQGEAGVGKSRLVFETVSALSGAGGLVLYTLSDSAISVASRAANVAHTRLVLVADECSVDTRHRLGLLLDGHKARIRVIAIDNSLVRESAADPDFLLRKMPSAALREVLEMNFPAVPAERRRAYAELAEGFPRLAVNLCREDLRIVTAGDLRPALGSIRDYFLRCLSDDQRIALSALALVTRVGCAGEVSAELHALAEFLGLPETTLLQSLSSIREGSGFVVRAGRYLYVTPEIIARVAFQSAWHRWASNDPERFLSNFPPSLLDSFLTRVERSASEEVRAQCARRFRHWIDRLHPSELASGVTVDHIVSLVDIHPGPHLPLVRRIIETATDEELRNIDGERQSGRNGWGPRRALVWMAERFAQVPEHWDDAERILARLALNETEQGIANNATAIWQQGFRIFLSGTATPFLTRLARLRDRLGDVRPEMRALARGALASPLEAHVSRMVGPAIVAGRIPPSEWRPTTYGELDACINASLSLAKGVCEWGVEGRNEVVQILTANVRTLASQGYLSLVRDVLGQLVLEDGQRVALLEQLGLLLEYDLAFEDGGATSPHDSTDVPESGDHSARLAAKEMAMDWHAELHGTDFRSRVIAFVGQSRWGVLRQRDELAWKRQLESLAMELQQAMSDLDSVEPVLSFLEGPEASCASEFGEELGRCDTQGILLQSMLSRVSPHIELPFVLGYVKGLISVNRDAVRRLTEWMDGAEAVMPEVVARVALAAGTEVDALERVLRLYDEGRLGPKFLYAPNFSAVGDDSKAPLVLGALLERLVAAAERGDDLALRMGLDNLAMRLPYEPGATQDPLFEHSPDLLSLSWRLLDAVPSPELPPSHWWGSLISQLAFSDAARAAQFLASRLGHHSIFRGEPLELIVKRLARTDPRELMDAVGEAMLSGGAGYGFLIGDYAALFRAIPDAVKRAWVERVGVEGARILARHVIAPTIDDQGRCIVDPFTEWLLKTFEGDHSTFVAFCAGTRSWRFYSGDIADQHDEEVRTARAFLDHPLRSLREWAVGEEQQARTDAERERQEAAERDLY